MKRSWNSHDDDSPEETWDYITKFKDNNIPETNILPDRGWTDINKEAKWAIKSKHNLCKVYLLNKNIKTYEAYEKARNRATSEVKKSNYDNEQIIAEGIKSNLNYFGYT